MKNLLNRKYKTIVVGETALCIKCCQYLVSLGWELLAVISDDKKVITWCENSNVKSHSFFEWKYLKYKDYILFSIVNYNIIPQKLLMRHKVKLAINYHDSLLPTYAGINSTTWAIFNKERKHGITWHVITPGVDKGDILSQAVIDINPDETTYSLNLKCVEKAICLFNSLVKDIQQDQLSFTKQNLFLRSYYGRDYLPKHYGIIQAFKNWKDVSRCCRALYFGKGHDNPITTPKIIANNQFYIVTHPVISNLEKRDKIKEELFKGIEHTFKGKIILFPDIKNIYGEPIKEPMFKVVPYNQYIICRDELNFLANIKKEERHNKFLLLKLGRINSFAFNSLSCNLNKSMILFSYVNKEKLTTVHLISIICLVLLKIFNKEFFLTYYKPVKKSEFIQNLLDNKSFIKLKSSFKNKTIAEFETYIQENIDSTIIISKDFLYRYQLMELLTDIGIYFGKISNSVPERHRLIFNINEGGIKIYGKDQDKILINTFESSLKEVISHYSSYEKNITQIKTVNLIPTKLYQRMVYEWNKTEVGYSHEKSLVELFATQVKAYPNKTALVCADVSLSYRTLDEKSNQLARYLRKCYQEKTGHALAPDTLIALCMERSIELVIGLLGILKSGGAYVPLEPSYPDERLGYIISDTQSQLLVTQASLCSRWEQVLSDIGQSVTLVPLDTVSLSKESVAGLSPMSGGTDLAYVIYTSGTTGQPKGVMIEHHSVVNTIEALSAVYQLTVGDKVSAYAAYVFDVSVSELWSSLLQGGELHILSSDVRHDARALSDYIQLHQLNYVYLPPVMLSQLPKEAYTSIRGIIIAGECCDRITGKYWGSRYALYNYYGPTESSIYATGRRIVKDEMTVIGKAIANTKLYVLDASGLPLPPGVAGELHIGGAGLARGYLNRPGLTAEKFIENRFATVLDKAQGYERLYKTGDVVRWLGDGSLEYIGRNDFQVKLRGYRIELGEIESVLLGYPGIEQACVLLRCRSVAGKEAVEYLVGYYVSEVGIEESELLAYMGRHLPEYMVPQVYSQLESMPLTVNGKLDRDGLPDVTLLSEAGEYIAPRDGLEERLCGIWSNLLGIERVGIGDNFFRLGGDSILSIQLTSQLRAIDLPCRVKTIFEYPTIERLAKYLSKTTETAIINAEQGNLNGDFALLPIQSWFFEHVVTGQFGAYQHWNQSFLVKVPPLDLKKLTQVIAMLMTQHDALRLCYPERMGKYQRYLRTIPLPSLKLLDVSQLDTSTIHQYLTKWQNDFTIETGPLWTIGYLHGYQDGTARLYFAAHHLIIDAVSWRILIEDIKRLYENHSLEDKTSSYRQWVDCVTNYAQTHSNEVEYWVKQCEALPNYHDKLPKPSYCYSQHFYLDQEITQQLLQQVQGAYHTEINDLLLTALAYTLQAWQGDAIQGVTLEGHGREAINPHIDTSRTLGWFTTMYPVKLTIQSTMGESIKHIKDNLRHIPHKGIGYGALRYQNNSPLAMNDLPPISFNYLGQFDTAEGIWQLTGEDAGLSVHAKNGSPFIIAVTGLVIESQMRFYLTTQLSQQETEQLTKNFQQQLMTITQHCVAKVKAQEQEYTPSDFSSVRISWDLLNRLQKTSKAYGQAIEAIYPASSLQQGFIYHTLSQPDDDAYRMQVLFDYDQSLNIAHYKRAWELAVQTYPILRTAFNWEEEILQIIYQHGALSNRYHDISHLDGKDEKDKAIRQIQQQDRAKGFDLSQPSLLRLHIIKHNEQHYTILKSGHHSITDGWSEPILINRVHTYYAQLQNKQAIRVNGESTYLEAQRYYTLHRAELKAYWQSRMVSVEHGNDLMPLLNKQVDLEQVRQMHFPVETHWILPEHIYVQLKTLVQEKGLTLNVLLQFAWHKLIQVYTRDNQTIVGTTLSGRDIPIVGIEHSVGLYINTLPLIVDWDNTNTVQEQLYAIHRDIIELNNHSFINLASLQREGKRLFHSLLVFENYPVIKEISDQDNRLVPKLRESIEKLDYPLGLSVREDKTLRLQLRHDETILSQALAHQHLSRLQSILEVLPRELDKPHQHMSLLTTSEYQRIVYEWNKTEVGYSHEKSLVELFATQVKAYPNKTALVCADVSLSYRTLDEKSNQLARYLRKCYQEKTGHALAPDTLIALCMERSIELVIGLLGILKSGGAYVPLEPSYPDERLGYIISDTQSQLLVTQASLCSRWEQVLSDIGQSVTLVPLDTVSLSKESVAGLSPMSGGTDLAYVIYTSGTTGQPKGVLQPHGNVIRLFSTTAEHFNFTENDTWALYHSHVFDFSVWELWGALLHGGKLFIPSSTEIKDIALFYQLCITHEVSVLNQTPSAFYQFAKVAAQSKDWVVSKIRYIILGGEAVNERQLNTWWKYVEGHNLSTQLINMYGITETTVHVTFKELSKEMQDGNNIGKPLNDLKAYVLDASGLPLPPGVAGELHIGGAGLARGYLNRPGLTAEKFIENRFATVLDKAQGYERLYKTGDVVRWLGDGSLEYIGRNDFQVKLRGYRIELGEIESVLLGYPGIEQACVLLRCRSVAGKEAVEYLVGYYVSEVGIEESELLAYMGRHLPEYMVPQVYSQLESMPLTVNGKLDRDGLPDVTLLSEAGEYIAPRDGLEERLCGIWSNLLGIERVGIGDNFFRLGGNSILAIQLIAKLNKLAEFESINIVDLFEYDTIQKLVSKICGVEKTSKYKLQKNYQSNKHDIAIIGFSGQFPGADNIKTLWKLIINQEEGINYYSKEQCEKFNISDEILNNENYISAAGYIENIDLFDPQFWDISINEAKQLDPQIRKFLEHCWYVLEQTGYVKNRELLNIGVFAGSGHNTYFYKNLLHNKNIENVDLWEATILNSKDALATKIAFLLGLTGPANSINTACSTSLVTVIEACKNLCLGTCDMAIAGGVSLLLPTEIGYVHKEGMILSKDGHCRVFDRESSGTVKSSGVGAVLLKRLEDAIKDKDEIIAVINGYATNNDGNRKTGYTAPSIIGQSECILNAQIMAGIKAHQIDYIECHGTGTNLGDPIEVQALKEVFKINSNELSLSKHTCVLGAIKANIGHTDSAAGIAGLIKVCCMLQNRVIPGQANFLKLNPNLHLKSTNFKINTENKSWLSIPGRPRLAGVSSFGIGGTNAHIIIGKYEYNIVDNDAYINRVDQGILKSNKLIFPLSAKSRKSLEKYRKVFIEYLQEISFEKINLYDIAYTLQNNREHFKYRMVVDASNYNELIASLKNDIMMIKSNLNFRNKIVFMFPGQGSQYKGMAFSLYQNEPSFRKIVDQCISFANQSIDINLYEVLYSDAKNSVDQFDINQTQWSQITLFIISYALAKFLYEIGINADTYIGHSIGEFVAATLAGIFRLEDAIKLVIKRGELMQAMDQGSMLAIRGNCEKLGETIIRYDCEIAVVNSHEDIVVSGTDASINNLKLFLDNNKISSVKLNTSHAYHSRMMKEAVIQFEHAFKNIKLRKPRKIFISTVTGKWINSEVTTIQYWCMQLRYRVEFNKGIENICKKYNNNVTFIEIGMGRGLSSFVKKNNSESIQTIPLLASKREYEEKNYKGITCKEDVVCTLWSYGIIDNFKKYNNFINPKHITNLPVYQFDYKSYWFNTKVENNSSVLPVSKWLKTQSWKQVITLDKNDKKISALKMILLIINSNQDLLTIFKVIPEQCIMLTVILDHNANVFVELRNNLIKINPNNEIGYKILFKFIVENQIKIDSVLNIASIKNDIKQEEDTSDRNLSLSFYSIFLVKQYILQISEIKHLVVLTNGLSQIYGDDIIYPLNGAVVGAIKNIANEIPEIKSLVIDIDSLTSNSWNFIHNIIKNNEMVQSKTLFAIRKNILWQEIIETVKHIDHKTVIKNKDVILITGGLGGVALAIAEEISFHHKVNFILVSRNNINSNDSHDVKKMEIINKIKDRDCNVKIKLLDISVRHDISDLIEYILELYGRLDGIIHTAGVTPISSLDYNLCSIKEALKGKVFGLDNIVKEVSNKIEVRYIINTSSLASIIGDINRIEYCAANSYLDYFSKVKHFFKKTKILTINWPIWLDIGMSTKVINSQNVHTYKQISQNAVSAKEGREIFYKLINQSNYNQIIISKFDIDSIVEQFFHINRQNKEEDIVIYEDEYTELEYKTAQIICEVLGNNKISIQDNFFKMGGSSLSAIQVAHRVSEIVNTRITVSDIFKYPNVIKLCNFINSNILTEGGDTWDL